LQFSALDDVVQTEPNPDLSFVAEGHDLRNYAVVAVSFLFLFFDEHFGEDILRILLIRLIYQ
jgi:hypothetical protein